MAIEKLSIISKGKDVCRIIPFNGGEEKYDFKIDFLEKEFEVDFYKVFEKRPYTAHITPSEKCEISYHRNTDEQPTKIHIKGKVPQYDGSTFYQTLPIKKIINPTPNLQFPIPLLKIEMPFSESSKNFDGKTKGKRICDIENDNVTEIYLCDKNFDVEQFSKKYVNMFFSLMTTPFEVFATNHIGTGFSKYNHLLYKDHSPRTAMMSFPLNNDMKIIINRYNDENVNYNLDKMRVTFIENQLYLHIWAMMLIEYPLCNPITGDYDNIYIGCSERLDNLADTCMLLQIDPNKRSLLYHDIMRMQCSNNEKTELLKLCTKLKRELRKEINKNNS